MQRRWQQFFPPFFTMTSPNKDHVNKTRLIDWMTLRSESTEDVPRLGTLPHENKEVNAPCEQGNNYCMLVEI